jgi:PleD family two-component response regulator
MAMPAVGGVHRSGRGAERIVEVLAEPFPTPVRPVFIGASVGVITAAQGDDPDRELRRADGAMYEAKAAGRNRVRPAAR